MCVSFKVFFSNVITCDLIDHVNILYILLYFVPRCKTTYLIQKYIPEYKTLLLREANQRLDEGICGEFRVLRFLLSEMSKDKMSKFTCAHGDS
jgi:hypothetical protein